MSATDDPPPGRPRLTLLRQREIEARIAGPLIAAFAAEVGEARALALVGEVISDLARQGGADLARSLGETSLEAFAGALELWKEAGALEIDLLESSADALSFNVTRCHYAEMYRALGLDNLGATLSCRRDFALIEGFNPAVGLTRTQTLMEGASFCDFRFRARPDPPSSDEPGNPGSP